MTAEVHIGQEPPAPLETRPRQIALAGNPNCGKTTLFNAMTGLRQKVGNYPGVTVEKKAGKFFGSHGEAMEVLDLPGTYSLHGRSPDEAIACEVLLGERIERRGRTWSWWFWTRRTSSGTSICWRRSSNCGRRWWWP